ncbi:MAG: bifunctional phosphoribosylaminoimidazolecarboxamide formyltransferase/IMP cyclohydrolase [Anaerolineae bacterium]|nr:bifunctional phosphoribosylaminoimidazolecarboxamide formyltransferase/IMP cyclohydrolase [Anaerolineae bacterium]
MPRALLSVYDKSGLVEFARVLADLGWELVASGGTARALTEGGLSVINVDSLTKHPEVLGGRVKTLHPAVHAAVLARDIPEDMQTLHDLDYTPIDMVVSNLYPFEETVSNPNVTLEAAVENIDIGGVALQRAAAKNFERVLVITDPADYKRVATALNEGRVDLNFRRGLAEKAFYETSQYDMAIFSYLTDQSNDGYPLRYGENPHQSARFISDEPNKILGGTLLGGKELSYNNLLDLDAAYSAVEQFTRPTAIIVKHLSPIGIASADTISAAFTNALAADPVSAFGGVIAVNGLVDMGLVDALGSLFVEVLAAPRFSDEAVIALRTGRKNCRLMQMDTLRQSRLAESRTVRGGRLVQSVDIGDPEDAQWKVVTERAPTDDEMASLRFAWKACQFAKSNAIVLAVGETTVGIGGGLPSRVDAAILAIQKAGERSKGAVMASDAFFPFPDSVEAAIRAGVTAIIQPGGSVRDDQSIATANAAGVAMVATGVRHFRH